MTDNIREELAALDAQYEQESMLSKALEQELEIIARKYAAEQAALNERKQAMYKLQGKRTMLRNDLLAQSAREASLAELKARKSAFQVDTFSNEPWYKQYKKHQWDGAVLAAMAKRAIVADGMGLGKTMTSIIFSQIAGSQKGLVIAPDAIVNNFQREISKWSTVPVVSLRKTTKAIRAAILTTVGMLDKVIVVVGYEAWRKDMSLIDSIVSVGFDTLICDEAHSIKDTGTIAFKGVEKIVNAYNMCKNCDVPLVANSNACNKCHTVNPSLAKSINGLLFMTGTPILNKPTDLFPLLHLMNPDAWAHKTEYIRSYCAYDSEGKLYFTERGKARLVMELGDAYIQRNRTDAGIELPTQDVIIHEIEFNDTEYLQQQQVIKDLNDVAAIILGDEALPMMQQIEVYTRLRQASVMPAGIVLKIRDPETKEVVREVKVADHVQESIKIDTAINLITEATLAGERVVLFSQFKPPLAELHRRLSDIGINSVRYDGDTPAAIRDRVQFDFDRGNDSHEYDVVLCHYKTGGVGLNFTAATQCIILDEEWNPGKRDQAYARLDRIGQTEESTVHVLRIVGTIDEYLMQLIEDKEAMINGFESTRLAFNRAKLI